ncbi:MAG: hypothetical protein ACJ8H8_04765 [Geminicoccaceae bacterium]
MLANGGLFLLWEPTRFDDESREAWLERCEDRWGACLHILTAEKWSAMADHGRAANFPETVSTWLGMGREAGFSRVSKLLQARFDLARVYCFWAQRRREQKDPLAHRLTRTPSREFKTPHVRP